MWLMATLELCWGPEAKHTERQIFFTLQVVYSYYSPNAVTAVTWWKAIQYNTDWEITMWSWNLMEANICE